MGRIFLLFYSFSMIMWISSTLSSIFISFSSEIKLNLIYIYMRIWDMIHFLLSHENDFNENKNKKSAKKSLSSVNMWQKNVLSSMKNYQKNYYHKSCWSLSLLNRMLVILIHQPVPCLLNNRFYGNSIMRWNLFWFLLKVLFTYIRTMKNEVIIIIITVYVNDHPIKPLFSIISKWFDEKGTWCVSNNWHKFDDDDGIL